MPSQIDIKEKVDLSPFNTMGIHSTANYFAEVSSVDDLKEALVYSNKYSLRTMILGGGSNVLFTNDFPGLIILNRITGINLIGETENEVILKVGAGENWHGLVLYCVNKGYGGIENLSLIPGTVGAAPIQNIGAYGVELVDVFVELEALDRESGEVVTLSGPECNFGYRDSIFKRELKDKMVIASVTLKLGKNKTPDYKYASLRQHLESKGITDPSIKQVSDAVIEVRQSKLPDPNKIGNTGSFFKNPVIPVYQFDELKQKFPDLPGYPVTERQVKVPAGWLIEKAGWKGKRHGQAGVHDKQALVLVNHGNASGNELIELAGMIQDSIKQQFEIQLTPEVNLIY